MYVMLFYDKYYKDKHEYFLLDTDKEISELEDFIAYYRDKYTKLKDSDIVYSTRSTWNEWHYMRTELPHWYVNYKSKRNEDVPVEVSFTFYKPQIIDDGGNNYHLLLLHKSQGEPRVWFMYLVKSDNDILPIAKDICKNLNIKDFEYEEIILQPIKI